MKKFKYQEIVDRFETMIYSDILKMGERLPSLRALSQSERGSISSAYQAYVEMEGKGLIEARANQVTI